MAEGDYSPTIPSRDNLAQYMESTDYGDIIDGIAERADHNPFIKYGKGVNLLHSNVRGGVRRNRQKQRYPMYINMRLHHLN